MTQDNQHNEMPKDTVEDLMELIVIGQVTRKDIEDFRTTVFNKGVEVGRGACCTTCEKKLQCSNDKKEL